MLSKVAWSIIKYTLRPGRNLKSRYGDDWAIITDAYSCIGKAYACELASQGFKVGLVGKNRVKLDAMAQAI